MIVSLPLVIAEGREPSQDSSSRNMLRCVIGFLIFEDWRNPGSNLGSILIFIAQQQSLSSSLSLSEIWGRGGWQEVGSQELLRR